MKTKHLIGMALVAILAIGNVNSASAQRDKTKTEISKKSKEEKGKKDLSPEEREDLRRKRQMAYSEAITFENMKLATGQYYLCKAEAEYNVIGRGDSTRIRYLIDPKQVLRLEVEGFGEMSPEDLKKGEWIITVKPEKNTYYPVRRTLIINGVAYVSYDGTAIIVVEPDKVQEVKDKFKEFSKNLDYKGKSAYLRQLLGDEYFEMKKKELETNNENFKAAFGPGSVLN